MSGRTGFHTDSGQIWARFHIIMNAGEGTIVQCCTLRVCWLCKPQPLHSSCTTQHNLIANKVAANEIKFYCPAMPRLPEEQFLLFTVSIVAGLWLLHSAWPVHCTAPEFSESLRAVQCGQINGNSPGLNRTNKIARKFPWLLQQTVIWFSGLRLISTALLWVLLAPIPHAAVLLLFSYHRSLYLWEKAKIPRISISTS